MKSRFAMNRLLMLCLLCSSVAWAQTGMGFGGGDELSDWQAAILFGFFGIFALLVLIGFLSSIGAFLINTKLEPERLHALRFIGLNWLEPTLTILAVIAVFILAQTLKPSTMILLLWFLLPLSTFGFSLFPPIFFSSQNVLLKTTWRSLRLIALFRFSSLGVLLLVLTFVRSFEIAIVFDAIGLAVLAWSFLRLGKLATRLSAQELQTSSQRTIK